MLWREYFKPPIKHTLTYLFKGMDAHTHRPNFKPIPIYPKSPFHPPRRLRVQVTPTNTNITGVTSKCQVFSSHIRKQERVRGQFSQSSLLAIQAWKPELDPQNQVKEPSGTYLQFQHWKARKDGSMGLPSQPSYPNQQISQQQETLSQNKVDPEEWHPSCPHTTTHMHIQKLSEKPVEIECVFYIYSTENLGFSMWSSQELCVTCPTMLCNNETLPHLRLLQLLGGGGAHL